MKKLAYFLIIICLLGFFSCKEMDSTYEQFVVPNGIIYPQKADSLKVYPGLNKVRITWQKGKDPKVVKAKVYWNNYTDSLAFSVPENDIVSVDIGDLDESEYTFYVRTFDAEGNASVITEVSGKVYGETYLDAISNRSINSLSTSGNGLITIGWGPADIANGAAYMEVVYTDNLDGDEQTVRTPASESVTNITDYGANLRYRTVFMPDILAIEPFPIKTEYQEVSGYFFFNKTNWKVLAYSSQLNASYSANNAIDGQTTNRWITTNTAYPHSITLDMNAVVTVAQLAVWPSIEAVPAGTIDTRFPTRIRFEVSLDNLAWKNLGEYDSDNTVNIRGARFFDVPPTSARYYRLTGLETTPGQDGLYMILGELDVYCK
ncbi:hypothetical protein EZS27_029599 [termite gut metagenome]|uniref:F5/8 type C domain-containing protein n=1 Tax=termite gut metagenome TaxID=433724 RepID=A0A5J4QGG2_9ZZZZ